MVFFWAGVNLILIFCQGFINLVIEIIMGDEGLIDKVRIFLI